MTERLTDLIALALPYVEDAAELDENSQSGKREILRLARDMRAAVEKEGPTEPQESLENMREVARDLYLALDNLNDQDCTDYLEFRDQEQVDLALSRYAWCKSSTDILEVMDK